MRLGTTARQHGLGRVALLAVVVALVGHGPAPVSAVAPPAGTTGRPLRVGLAKTDITWHVGNERLGPVVESHDPHAGKDPLVSPGIHSRLYAKAIVIEGPEPFAVIRTDTPGISGDLYESVAQRVQRDTGISPENLLLAATHTHVANQGAFPHPVHGAVQKSSDPREKEFIASRIAEAVVAAHADLRPALFAAGVGEVKIPAFNRRQTNHPELDANDDAFLDPELGIMRFDDAETGAPIAVVMNYGLHPVVLHPEVQPLVTADFVGLAERDLERALARDGRTPMAIWHTGAVGDQNPVYELGGYAKAEWTGRVFADEATRVAQTLRPKPLRMARVASKLIPLPPPPRGPEDLADGRLPWMPAPLSIPSSVRIQAIELTTHQQRTVLLSWPGEPIRDLGTAMKTAAHHLGFEQAFVMGLANDWGGYWLTPEEHDRTDTYERWLSFYGRTSSNYVMQHVLNLAQFLADGTEIEEVPLPPQAEADRAITAAIAAEGIAREEQLADAHAPPPDPPPSQPMAELGPVSAGTPVKFSWRGGSPDVNRDWIPRVAIERKDGPAWVTVAQEGAGEIIVWQRTPTPGDSQWTAVWQPLFESRAGEHRYRVRGAFQGVATVLPYELTSPVFRVTPCACIKAGEVSVTADSGKLRIAAAADYPEIPDSIRLLPTRVTTGRALVNVLDSGTVVDTLTLTFVSRIEPIEQTVVTVNAKEELHFVEPVENGDFQAVWSGDHDVDFELVSVVDGFGNTTQ